jgi:hypothetical protein
MKADTQNCPETTAQDILLIPRAAQERFLLHLSGQSAILELAAEMVPF